MFDQQNDQNNQQQGQDTSTNDQGTNDPASQSQSPAAPPADHDFAPPKPAYDSVFDEQPAADSPAPSDDNLVATSQPQPPAAPVQDDELLNIKQQALQQLSPLVGQLEQSPEEKFHTTMRIIQASDNHSLVKDAYDAARQIEDDKVRAQALLDIINEINYFTKDDASEEQPPEQPS